MLGKGGTFGMGSISSHFGKTNSLLHHERPQMRHIHHHYHTHMESLKLDWAYRQQTQVSRYCPIVSFWKTKVSGPRGLSASFLEACDSPARRDLADRPGIASRSSVCERATLMNADEVQWLLSERNLIRSRPYGASSSSLLIRSSPSSVHLPRLRGVSLYRDHHPYGPDLLNLLQSPRSRSLIHDAPTGSWASLSL